MNGERKLGPVERVLRLFTDIRAGEAPTALLLALPVLRGLPRPRSRRLTLSHSTASSSKNNNHRASRADAAGLRSLLS